MYKTSIVRIEQDNSSDMKNKAMNDIIATDNVEQSKKSSELRFSRACKILAFIVTCGLVVTGVILLALNLALVHNKSTGLLSRSTETNKSTVSNSSRLLNENDEDSATINSTSIENEYSSQTTLTVSSDNLDSLPTQRVDIQLPTKKIIKHETLPSEAQSTPTDELLNMTAHEQSTSSSTRETVVDNQQTTLDSVNSFVTAEMSTEDVLISATNATEEDMQTTSDKLVVDTVEDNSIRTEDQKTPVSNEPSFSNHINDDFDNSSSTTISVGDKSEDHLSISTAIMDSVE